MNLPGRPFYLTINITPRLQIDRSSRVVDYSELGTLPPT
jgi:hypothetical protein